MKIDFDRIRAAEWDTTHLSGGAVIARMCPACAAHVPTGSNYDGISYREMHIRWHEFLQRCLIP